MNGVKRHIIFCLAILLFVIPVCSQEAITLLNKDYIPPTPASSAFKKYMSEQPTLSTGSVNLSIPLYELNLYDVTIPFSLKYNTGGIKVYDDPYPCGFGWSMLPALKITRTIMGRPDEHFEYVGDRTNLQGDFQTLQRCMTNFQSNGHFPNRYDSQHDIFTVGLLDGNYTYIIDKSAGYMNFISVGCSEIKISADTLLQTINVIDASGLKYRFIRGSERCGEAINCLAWILKELTLTNGKVITFYWRECRHTNVNGREVSANSFNDEYDYTEPHNATTNRRIINNNIYGELAEYSNIIGYQHLDSISFEGGYIKFKYISKGGGDMIKSFTVTNHTDTIKHIAFEYGYDRPECFLLNSLTFNDEGTYKFQYNPNRFQYKYTQDYWGYYNGKLNEGCVSRVPTVRMFVHENIGDVGQYITIESADRSIDREKMQANILTCVTYPTGGKTTFEYEPHRFPPMRLETNGVIDTIYDPKLSEGGGLRVTKITTYSSADDTDSIIRRYVYGENENGLAYCRAVPSLATFIDCFNTFSIDDAGLYPFPDYWHRRVNINPSSNYMSYDIGQTPIWYRQVTEYNNEGKTVYDFKDFIDNNEFAVGLGHRYIIHLNKVFSKGPQLTKKTIYRLNSDNTYTEVQRIANSYTVKYHPDLYAVYSTHISRKIIQIAVQDEHVPDFNEEGYVRYSTEDPALGVPREQIYYCDKSETYHASQYGIAFKTEQLTGTTVTDFVGNGSVANTTSYGYLKDSKLVDCVVKSSSENTTEKLQLYYTTTFTGTSFLADSLSQRPILFAMRDSNIIVPVLTKVTNGSSVITSQHVFCHKGKRLYQPHRTLQRRGINAEVKELCRYDWDALGNMRSRIYPDKSKEFMMWGYNGRYLLFHLKGADYASLRGPVGNELDDLSMIPTSSGYSALKSSLDGYGLLSSFEYLPMIGLFKSTSPWGERTLYYYDDCNRLARITKPPYGILKKFEYNRYDEFETTDMRKWGGRNYVVTREYIKSNKYIDRVDYYDGLGRPSISATIGITPTGNDLYELTEYDNMGRESAKWLPAVCDFNGALISNDTFKSASASIYSDNHAFELIEYECSPRGQPRYHTRPGAQWHSADKKTETKIRTNTDEPRFQCRDYNINADGSLGLKGNYHGGKLYITETIDEDGRIVMEFKDLRGNVVLKRRFLSETQTADTYYVYDDLDDLRYILSPKLSERLTSVGSSWTESNEDMARWGYCFRYDDAGNCIYKKMPGCNASYFKYDKGNRLVAERDGAMSANRWKVHFYDKYSREVITGIMSATEEEIDILTDTIVTARLTSTYTQLYGGYEFNITLPADIYPCHNINYYDTYTFYGTETDFDFENSGLGDGLVASVKGRQSGVLQYDSNNGALLSVYYYNVRGDIIQQRSRNFLGGMDNYYCSYSHTGKPEEATEIHTTDIDSTIITRNYVYTYDDADRLLKVTHQLNNYIPMTLAEYVYDELGRVSKLKNSANETDYEYTTQGWVKKIENDRFVQELSYAPGCYNGNVSSNLWGDKAGTTRRYDYTYDKLNRLTSAVYVEPSRVEPPGVILDAGPDYSAYYSYDLNGNILTLSRAGIWDKTSINDNDQLWCYELIDDMEFHYDGNRLMKIDDYGSDGIFEEAPGFIDGNTDGNDYTWNGNGSMTSDLNTGITRITYNDINLPHFVTFNNGHQTVYVYSCDGRKLQATYQVAVTATTSGASTYARYRTEMIKKYSGDYIYENDTLTTILFDGGYIDMSVGLPLYHFYTRDYQGNIRVTEDISGNKVERYDYYPYGALFGETSPSQDYLYGGKEWERTYGMNHYDFHARWMNPLTTRFTTQDPLQLDYAELSSYSYCAGNPVLYIDPTGEFLDILWDIGNLIYDVYAAVDAHISGNHDKATEHWIDAGVDLAATIIPGVPAGGSKLARMADDVVDVATDATKTADKVTDASKSMKNASSIKEGKDFEKSSVQELKNSGAEIKSQVTIVPKNGKGNVNGNRSRVDAFINNGDDTYSVIEYKLSDKTPLSKGQKAVQNHVNGGNQMFEVRSTVDHMNLYPGKPIQVKDYRVEYKYEYKLKNK